MKKFIITLFILIILGGLVFFFGWAQFSVPPGAYGVINSKTHGTDPYPIVSGEFRWIWYKLIPSNVNISIFHLAPVDHTINVQGVLPSGNVYAAFTGGQVDFSWEFDASFSFSLNPEKLVRIVTENNIANQEELSVYQKNLADKIETFIVHYLAVPTDAAELEDLMSGQSQALENRVLEQFPVIADFSCIVKNVRFPDFALYRLGRGLYEDFIAKQREASAVSMSKNAENRINSFLKIDELERYGELLTKYPILLEYLLMERNNTAE